MVKRLKSLTGTTGSVSEMGDSDEINTTWEVWDTDPVEQEKPNYVSNLLDYAYAEVPAYLDYRPDGYTDPLRRLYRGPVNWREDEDKVERYLLDIKYRSSELEKLESLLRWNFDTQGGTVKLFTSKATARFPAGAPDMSNSIDVDENNEPQGVDVVIPALKLSCRKRWLRDAPLYKHDTFLTYMKTLTAITGTTNQQSWRTFAAGELLFLGATGEYQEGKDNEIEYHFAASANATGLSIGSIANVTKRGHEYLWVRYKHNIVANVRVRQPQWAYVERVYGETNFATQLGIAAT